MKGMRRTVVGSSVRDRVAALLAGAIILTGATGCDGAATPDGATPSSSPVLESTPPWMPPQGEVAAAVRDQFDRIRLDDLVGMAVSEAKVRLGFPNNPPVHVDQAPVLLGLSQGLVSGDVPQLDEEKLTVTAAVGVSDRRFIYLGVAPSAEVVAGYGSSPAAQKNQDALITYLKLDGHSYIDAVYVKKKK